MENISEHISYSEAIYSTSGKRLDITNDPDPTQLGNMKNLAIAVFEPIRAHFNCRIYISSFFRSSALNKLIHGSMTSQHCKGEAMDLDADMYGIITNRQIFDYIKDNLDFDQLILENVTSDGNAGWVHVSYKTTGNRKEILIMKLVDNKPTYEHFA